MSTDVYTHGYHESVLRSHNWRTAANSAAHLLPHLRAGQRLLDVGCGGGTITTDLATLVAPGEVVGVDVSAEIVERARAHAAQAGVTADFQVGDVYRLAFPDASFDVVHAHQLLQHLTDPVAAIREMRRVTRPGGIVALREGDFGAFTWYPQIDGLEDWRHLYHEVTAANRAQADAGRRVLSWALRAGFAPEQVEPSAGVWCFATPEDRAWWSSVWAERVVSSDFARQAKEYGLADDVALEALRDAWEAWGKAPDGWYVSVHGQVIARV
jgi:ubiquinone/menaquinone biosynthesis C-methylase UbiE